MIPALLLLGLSALVGKTGLGCCQKHTRNCLQKDLGEAVCSRPGAPFLHGPVRSGVAEGPQLLYVAACCPHVPFKPAHLETGLKPRDSQPWLLLGFPANLIQSPCLLRNGLAKVAIYLIEAICSSVTGETG